MKHLKKSLFAFILLSNLTLSAQQMQPQNKLRIAVSGGYSQRLAKISDEVPIIFKDYVNGLKSGYNFGADVQYFFSSWGLGLSYSRFGTSNQISNVQATDINGNIRSGNMKENISIQFVAPSAVTRLVSANNMHMVTGSLAIGYLGYKDRLDFSGLQEFTGSTVGTGVDLGYDYRVADNIYIGAKLGLVAGVIKKITYNTEIGKTVRMLEENQFENLSRIDASVGVRVAL